MKKILTVRGGGKTTKLIHESERSGNSIVCRNRKECDRIRDKAEKMNKNIPFPLTYFEFVAKQYHDRGINGFLIDNVEDLIRTMSPKIPINAITLSIDDE